MYKKCKDRYQGYGVVNVVDGRFKGIDLGFEIGIMRCGKGDTAPDDDECWFYFVDRKDRLV